MSYWRNTRQLFANVCCYESLVCVLPVKYDQRKTQDQLCQDMVCSEDTTVITSTCIHHAILIHAHINRNNLLNKDLKELGHKEK